jgi:hypothetical protein
LPFFVCRIAGSRAPCAFFVDDGAAMIVASTMEPPRMIHPCSSKIRFCSADSRSPSLCSPSRRRKCSSVAAARTCSTAKSRPMNRRIAQESYTAPSTPSSDSENHTCSRYIRSIASTGFGLRPVRPL